MPLLLLLLFPLAVSAWPWPPPDCAEPGEVQDGSWMCDAEKCRLGQNYFANEIHWISAWVDQWFMLNFCNSMFLVHHDACNCHNHQPRAQTRGHWMLHRMTMRQFPLERDINIAVNGCSGFATSTKKGPFMAMLISCSRGTYSRALLIIAIFDWQKLCE